MAVTKHFVTVVGLSHMYPGIKKANVGDTVILRKEPSNPTDANAVKVFYRDGISLEEAGYVGNRSDRSTTFTGTETANEIQSLFNDEVEGRVSEIKTMKVGTNPNARTLVVELLIKRTHREAARKMAENQTLRFKLVGPKTMYPNKYNLLTDVKEGKSPYVKLVMSDDGKKIIAEYNGVAAGVVCDKNQNGVSDYDDILAAIGDGKNAKMTETVGMDIIGTFSVSEAELENQKTVVTLKGVCTKLVDEGLATNDELKEKISYMETNGVTQKQMIGMFGTYKSYGVDRPVAGKPETLFVDSAGILKRTIGYLNAKRNLLFIGDKGCGKNVLIDTLAWLFKRPLSEMSMNSGHDNSSLYGGKTIETDEAGKTKMGFEPETIVSAAMHGDLLNIDEINTGLAHLLSGLNSLLDDRKRITVPGFGLVNADSNFACIGTMNIDYQGTFDMNEATEDRFVPIIFPASNNLKEVLMEKVSHIVSIDDINACVKLFEDIHELVKKGEVNNKSITVRGFIDACKGTEFDIDLKDALIDNIANRVKDSDERKVIMDAIDANF